jgi:hypothetical protein
MDTVPTYVDWRACSANPLSWLSWQYGSSKTPATGLATTSRPPSRPPPPIIRVQHQVIWIHRFSRLVTQKYAIPLGFISLWIHLGIKTEEWLGLIHYFTWEGEAGEEGEQIAGQHDGHTSEPGVTCR